MKRLTYRLFGIFLLSFGAHALWAIQNPPEPITLEESYKRAVRVSETLLISDEEIRQLEALYKEGVGNVLPHVSWYWVGTKRDTTGTSSGTDQPNATRRTDEASFFQLTQPLFHGLKDFHAIAGIKAVGAQTRWLREKAAQDLLNDVANVFYTSYNLQEELGILQAQRDLTEDRLKDLRKRVDLGKSRASEVLSAEVDLASLDAQMEDVRRTHAAARQVFEFLTKIAPQMPLRDSLPDAPPLKLDQALTKVGSRPDVMAADENQRAAKYQVKFAKAGYWPNLDLIADYWTHREGQLREVDWDAILTLQVPLFEGLQTQAQVQGARSKAISADLASMRTRRLAKQEIQNAHQGLSYSQSQARYFERAVKLAERNYKVQQQEYRLGLINNLEVLRALTQLEDLRIQHRRAMTATKINAVRLKVAMGEGL